MASLAVRKQRAKGAVKGLKKLYPDAHCELDFKTPLQLAVATILSAQCTDKRVNVVTKTLFKRCKNVKDFAAIDIEELEGLVRSTGFYRNKAKSIQELSKALIERFSGKMPKTMKELLTLRGVARKTGNVILGSAFNLSEGIVVDTHMKRVSYRLGLTVQKDPVKVEQDLMQCVDPKDWNFFGHGMVWHGRRACYARNPDCGSCLLSKDCLKKGV
ncbi:MAG: endonuclease III [Elusimicrobia bacterium]|nr:MAG: endonuclease III [Elusimicrobiota bacterium]